MLIFAEILILCVLFTVMVYAMSREPIKTLYNYPPRIQERVMTLPEYKDRIPTKKNKLSAKIGACVMILAVLCIIMRFVNGYTTFRDAFLCSFFIWTVLSLYDVIVLDIIWFCHDPYFVFKGTEDMTKDYRDYLFHIKGFFAGELLALMICAAAGAIVGFIL